MSYIFYLLGYIGILVGLTWTFNKVIKKRARNAWSTVFLKSIGYAVLFSPSVLVGEVAFPVPAHIALIYYAVEAFSLASKVGIFHFNRYYLWLLKLGLFPIGFCFLILLAIGSLRVLIKSKPGKV